VSSLWTPDGEQPIRPARSDTGGGGGPGSAGPGPSDVLDDEAMIEQVEEMRRQLAESPVEVVIANHCYGLFELSAVYLSQLPPLLAQARVAIDAMAALVDGLEGRLGEAEPQLRDGLSQLRLAYVQIDGAQRAGAAATEGAANGTSEASGPADGGTGDSGDSTGA